MNQSPLQNVTSDNELIKPSRRLTLAQCHALAEVPAKSEWFANITNANTRRAYKKDLQEFMRFTGIDQPIRFREVSRVHIIAWRDELRRRDLAAATITRKLVF